MIESNRFCSLATLPLTLKRSGNVCCQFWPGTEETSSEVVSREKAVPFVQYITSGGEGDLVDLERLRSQLAVIAVCSTS